MTAGCTGSSARSRASVSCGCSKYSGVKSSTPVCVDIVRCCQAPPVSNNQLPQDSRPSRLPRTVACWNDGMISERSPLLDGKDYEAASLFEPANLLREARRQNNLPDVPVP